MQRVPAARDPHRSKTLADYRICEFAHDDMQKFKNKHVRVSNSNSLMEAVEEVHDNELVDQSIYPKSRFLDTLAANSISSDPIEATLKTVPKPLLGKVCRRAATATPATVDTNYFPAQN